MALGSGGFRPMFFKAADAGDSEAALAPFITFLAQPRTAVESTAWLIGALAVSSFLTYLRMRLGLGSSGVPLVFYLPSIILVALVTGWEFGLAALLFSVAIVWFSFVPPAFVFSPLTRDQSITLALWSVVCVPLVAIAEVKGVTPQADPHHPLGGAKGGHH